MKAIETLESMTRLKFGGRHAIAAFLRLGIVTRSSCFSSDWFATLTGSFIWETGSPNLPECVQ